MEDNYIQNMIVKLVNKDEVVSVFSDRDEMDRCSVGFIKYVNDDFIIIAHVTPNGLSDGFAVRKISDIFRIDKGGAYEKKIKDLYYLRKQNHDIIEVDDFKYENILVEMLHYSKCKDDYISISIDSNDDSGYIIGKVKDIDDKVSSIIKFSDFGEPDGETIIYIEDIESLNIASDDEYCIKLLSQKQN